MFVLLLVQILIFPCLGPKIMWKVKILVAQLCLTLCDSMDCIPPNSSVHRILQRRILDWVAISFSRGSSQPKIELGSPTYSHIKWKPIKWERHKNKCFGMSCFSILWCIHAGYTFWPRIFHWAHDELINKRRICKNHIIVVVYLDWGLGSKFINFFTVAGI